MTRTQADQLLTPDLLRWAARRSRRYALRYGDPDGRFEGSVGEALARACRTWHHGGAAFPSHARRVVVQTLNEALRRTGPLGFRHDPRIPGNHLGAPRIASLAVLLEERGDDLEAGIPPVGWEAEYADYVESMARRLPGIYGDVIRLMYLECRGATVTAAAKVLGLSVSRTWEIHAQAIAKIRARVRPMPDEAWELLRDVG